MASQPGEPASESQKTHRRETLTVLALPMAGVGALILIGTIIALLLPQRAQVSLIADLMVTVLVLCPAVICLFPVVLGVIAAAAGMGVLHDKTTRPLRRIESLTERLAQQTQRISDVVNRQAVNLGAKSAPLEHLLNVFERSVPSSPKDEQNDQPGD